MFVKNLKTFSKFRKYLIWRYYFTKVWKNMQNFWNFCVMKGSLHGRGGGADDSENKVINFLKNCWNFWDLKRECMIGGRES